VEAWWTGAAKPADLREARLPRLRRRHLVLFQHLYFAAAKRSHRDDRGNFLVANGCTDADPVEDRRFDYLEDMAAQGAFAKKRPFVWPGEELRAADLPFRFEIPRGAIRAGFASRYTVVDVAAGAPPLIQLDFAAIEGMGDPLVQVLMIRRDPDGIERLHDLLRSDRARWSCLLPPAGLADRSHRRGAEKPGRTGCSSPPRRASVLHMAPSRPRRAAATRPTRARAPGPGLAGVRGTELGADPPGQMGRRAERAAAHLSTAQGTTPARPLRAALAGGGGTDVAPLRHGATAWRASCGAAALPAGRHSLGTGDHGY